MPNGQNRIYDIDWTKVEEELNEMGYSVLTNVLKEQECSNLVSDYVEEKFYRSRVIMARYNFGRGEYKYYSYPLPELIQDLRSELFEGLSLTANNWSRHLRKERSYPKRLKDYLEYCAQRGQGKPTPLILKYGKGDYNCLHQDLYGEEIFPLQVAICLSEPDTDFTGGEFVLTHQRSRMQSVVDVIPLRKGDAVIFPVRDRPVLGKRGYFTVKMKHGVSKVRSGDRYVLGIIFHDAL